VKCSLSGCNSNRHPDVVLFFHFSTFKCVRYNSLSLMLVWVHRVKKYTRSNTRHSPAASSCIAMDPAARSDHWLQMSRSGPLPRAADLAGTMHMLCERTGPRTVAGVLWRLWCRKGASSLLSLLGSLPLASRHRSQGSSQARPACSSATRRPATICRIRAAPPSRLWLSHGLGKRLCALRYSCLPDGAASSWRGAQAADNLRIGFSGRIHGLFELGFKLDNWGHP